MRIRPDERRARPGEALDMQVVADAVPRTGVINTVSGGEGLQETVVVWVLEVELDDVVIDVLDGEIYLGAIHAHPLELQAGHRARGVLEQCLIYPQPHLLAGAELPFDHVILEDPGDQILRHCPSPRFPELAYVFYILILRRMSADALVARLRLLVLKMVSRRSGVVPNYEKDARDALGYRSAMVGARKKLWPSGPSARGVFHTPDSS